MTPTLERLPTKAKEAPPHEVRLAPLDTSPEYFNVSGKNQPPKDEFVD